MTMPQSRAAQPVDVETETLRNAIKHEYKEVAEHPDKRFHFHTGRRPKKIVGYLDEWFADVSERVIESFAGTGTPSPWANWSRESAWSTWAQARH